MSCEHPLLVVNLGIDPETGKKKIKMFGKYSVGYSIRSLESRYGAENVLRLPCGQCLSCRSSKSLDWSIRCVLEAKYHEKISFITLTYDEENYPGELCKKDLQLFFKRLRNTGNKIRYFACGEYGSQTKRGHYHAIIFGWFPEDVKPIGHNEFGDMRFKSKELDSLWCKGLTEIAIFSERCAGYVAGYTSKKLIDSDFIAHKTPPFLIMSKKPALGQKYYEDHLEEIYQYKGIQMPGGFFAGIPRSCDKYAEKQGIDIESVRADRKANSRTCENAEMNEHGFTRREDLIKYRDVLYKRSYHKKKRGL